MADGCWPPRGVRRPCSRAVAPYRACLAVSRLPSEPAGHGRVEVQALRRGKDRTVSLAADHALRFRRGSPVAPARAGRQRPRARHDARHRRHLPRSGRQRRTDERQTGRARRFRSGRVGKARRASTERRHQPARRIEVLLRGPQRSAAPCSARARTSLHSRRCDVRGDLCAGLPPGPLRSTRRAHVTLQPRRRRCRHP